MIGACSRLGPLCCKNKMVAIASCLFLILLSLKINMVTGFLSSGKQILSLQERLQLQTASASKSSPSFALSLSVIQRKQRLGRLSNGKPSIRIRIIERKGKQTTTTLNANNKDKTEEEIEEEVRINVYESRRKQIRSTLKSAESNRNFRLSNGFVPEIDEETGKPIPSSKSQFALTATAIAIAFGAIILRVGGRAAFVSAIGLDFTSDNPELQGQLQSILDYTDSMDILTKAGAFTLAWTVIKVSCFDAGGIALALSSGVLFGGVLQGAFMSAAAATIGSSVSFGLAKSDVLPFRKKSLEILEEYPALRGIEKVVARDGFKAILTLRLAPILPIPIGMYNYVYGVTNVPVFDFAAGIFCGSLKPYLLDSYLGYFGKSVMDGSINDGNSLQDILLLAVLGASVLLGVFASQLAQETWDSVLEEIEADKEAAQREAEEKGEAVERGDGITREFFSINLPQWMVGFQLALQQATYRMEDLIMSELDAKVWNYTTAKDRNNNNPIPEDIDPSKAMDSPEVVGRNKGIDYVGGLCDGLVMSPLLFDLYSKYSDPLFNEEDFKEQMEKKILERNLLPASTTEAVDVIQKQQQRQIATRNDISTDSTHALSSFDDGQLLIEKKLLLEKLDAIASKTKEHLDFLDERLKDS